MQRFKAAWELAMYLLAPKREAIAPLKPPDKEYLKSVAIRFDLDDREWLNYCFAMVNERNNLGEVVEF